MAPTALAYAGTEPIANSSDPMANRMAIHHPRALGAHHVEPTAGFWCLRWWRDSHRTISPSGRTKSTNVAGAPMMTWWPSRPGMVMIASLSLRWSVGSCPDVLSGFDGPARSGGSLVLDGVLA